MNGVTKRTLAESNTVAFFHISRGDFGGGSKMLLKLLRSLVQSSIEPVLISQAYDELCERAERSEITVKIVPFRGALDTYNGRLLTASPRVFGSAAYRSLQFNRDVYEYVRDADVVWCQDIRSVLTLLPCSSLLSTPLIWNIGLGRKSNGMYSLLNAIALAAADYVFIESKTQAKHTFTDAQLARHERKFVVFRKGIDVEKFHPRRDRPPLSEPPYAIGTAAALTPRKGLEYLLDAMIDLLETRDDVELHIAGAAGNAENERYAATLRDRVEAAENGDSVTFHGWIADMPNYLDTLDVFVLPSLNEGIPGAVREALAMELPVIATDVGGTGDVVRNHETGQLVPPADSRAIMKAIDTMLANPAEARRMGAAGRALITDDFSLESYARNYRHFLNEVSS